MAGRKTSIVVGLNAAIAAVSDEMPLILTTLARDDQEALPFGPLDPEGDRTLELGLRGWVREQTGVELGYVEQLYTFGDRNRDPRETAGGPRVISVAYLALVRQSKLTAPKAQWRDCYEFFPWEDMREGRPRLFDQTIGPCLEEWAAQADSPAKRRQRRDRSAIAFGLRGSPWDSDRVLDRYELVYEAGLVEESVRDAAARGRSLKPLQCIPSGEPLLGRPLALDHRRILATALGRLRGKIKYRPVVFELLPDTFTLFQLQRVVEALSGVRLHKQNFRRLVAKGGLVERTGQMEPQTGGRPAELFRFRREVLRERPAPGVGLPGLRV
ncbi:MAG TPA: NAD regulator [Acidobacteriota bacterium]|nr:NAD regulator [Acidobacteriota bacterium]